MAPTETASVSGPADAPGATPPSTVELAWDELELRRSGTGPPLLVLHGTYFPGSWLAFHTTLAQRFDVIAPTHPGFREGQPPPWLQGFDDLALFYRQLLDRLEIRQVHLVGHALGGWLAAELAILAPERVSGLTLLAPFGLRVADRPLADFLAAPPDRLGELMFGSRAAEFASLLPDLSTPAGFARSYGHHGVTARLMWERRYDLRLERRLPLVSAPAKVVIGDDDRIVPVEHGSRWSELLDGSSLSVLPGLAHALHVQDPERVAQEVTP